MNKINNLDLKSSEEYYQLAKKNLYKVELDGDKEIRLLNNCSIINKSISLVINHLFIETPSIEINLELSFEELTIGNYYLYLNIDNNIQDDYLYFK